MHRGNRIPHSLSMAVNDFPNFRLGATAVSVVDALGKAVGNPSVVKQTAYAAPAASLLTAEVLENVDPVVNWRPDPTGPREMQLPGPAGPNPAFQPPGAPASTFLSGVAQLQLGRPRCSSAAAKPPLPTSTPRS